MERRELWLSSPDERYSMLINVLAVSVGLGLAFQVGHFLEHALQFAVWLSGTSQWIIQNLCGRDTPFMSAPVMAMVTRAGAYLFPEASSGRQMMLGMEILHLVGNSVFLATIAGVLWFVPSKFARYALYIEGFHLCEHIALMLSAFYVGQPIGLSTAFGYAGVMWGKELAVGYRVTWHFLMNLLPLPFVMAALMEQWSAARRFRAA